MEEEDQSSLYFDAEALDAEEIIVQGFRRSRNRTNWLYRGSAMTTTDAMDIEELQLAVHDYETAVGYIASAFTVLALTAKSRRERKQSSLFLDPSCQ